MAVFEADRYVVDVRNAVVCHGQGYALKGVSLQVRRGEFLGVIGPNGAGKTTLVTLINGLRRPTSGTVRVLGEEMTGRSGHKIRRRVGYVPQLDSIDARMPMTVHDIVALGRYGRLGWFRRPGKRDKQLVNETLAMVGMTLLADRPVGQLSGGEQERAAIARCLAQEPELFLLDEPTAALDFRAKIDILELVKRIRSERNLTTVFVTHDLGFLPQTCDRVVLMKSGLIYGDGLPEDVLTNDNLASLYDLPLQAVKRRREIGICA